LTLTGGAAAVPTPMLPAAAGPAGLPVDSYTSSYGTNTAGGGLAATPLMYPSFQLPGAKPEGELHIIAGLSVAGADITGADACGLHGLRIPLGRFGWG
jgi:hypothetical protein